MAKNSMRLISSGLRSLQAPSRLRTLSLVGQIPSVGKSMSQFNYPDSKILCYRDTRPLWESPSDLPPVAINGFGRLGECVLRRGILQNLNVVAINQPGAELGLVARMIEFDVIYPDHELEVIILNENTLDISSKIVRLYTERDPEKIKWNELKVDYVIDTTGKFTKVSTAQKHMAAGVKKVIIGDLSEDAPMFVRGVNFDKYKKDMNVVSGASSVTNCAATLLHIMNEQFGVEYCTMTNVQASNFEQSDLDGARQECDIPYTTCKMMTDEAKAVGMLIPSLEGKVTGDSISVPWRDVSLLTLYMRVKHPVKLSELKSPELWSSDFVSYDTYCDGNGRYFMSICSAVVAFDQMSVFDDKFVTIGAWYDTNIGYSTRLLDLYEHMAKVDTEKAERISVTTSISGNIASR